MNGNGHHNESGNGNGRVNGWQPEVLTVWFATGQQVGLDVRWAGPAADRSAALARNRLEAAGHRVSLVEDELGWRVRVGPADRASVEALVGRFLGRAEQTH